MDFLILLIISLLLYLFIGAALYIMYIYSLCVLSANGGIDKINTGDFLFMLLVWPIAAPAIACVVIGDYDTIKVFLVYVVKKLPGVK
jgi:hypothetical protein